MKKHTQNLDHTQIAKLLTQSTEQLDEKTASSLRRASEVALQRRYQHEPVFSLNAIGHYTHDLFSHSTQQWVAITILIAAIIVGLSGYLQHSHQHANSHVDIEILTSDLPIEVFLDK